MRKHRHNAVFEDGRVLEAGCNAHGRRKTRGAKSVQPVLAKEGGAFISAIYVAEAEAQKAGLEGDELKRWRKKMPPPLAAKLRARMKEVEPTLTPGDLLAATIRSPISAGSSRPRHASRCLRAQPESLSRLKDTTLPIF